MALAPADMVTLLDQVIQDRNNNQAIQRIASLGVNIELYSLDELLKLRKYYAELAKSAANGGSSLRQSLVTNNEPAPVSGY